MSKNNHDNIILSLSIPLVISVIIVSYSGLIIPNIYSRETMSWTTQAICQDAINLFLIAPFLIITSILAYRKNTIAYYLWSGGIIYLCYTYVIYCFDIHFNNLFILYCLILGLSFYSLMYFLFSHMTKVDTVSFRSNLQIKSVSIYLLTISCLFIFLWLSEIIPATLNNPIPKTVIKIGTFTNPIQILDLSILLPGFIIISLLNLKRKSLGLLLVPAALTFCILMDITIGILSVFKMQNSHDLNWIIPMLMGLLTLITIMLLYKLFKIENNQSEIENKTKYYYPLRS